MPDWGDSTTEATPLAPLVPTRRVAAVVVGLLFVAVFVLRWLTDDVADATSLLYVLPIALSAAVFGRRAGIAAAVAAIVLFTSWIAATGAHITVLGWITRSTTMVVLGHLLGVTVDRLRSSERRLEEANALARLSWWDWDAGTSDRVTTSTATVLDPFEQDILATIAADAAARRSTDLFEHDVHLTAPKRWLHVRGEVCGAGRVHGTVQDVTELHEAADVRRDLSVAVARHRDAVEINDSIVQALSAAKWSLEAGNIDRGLDAVADALATAQQLVLDLLGDDVQPADDLLRSEPRSRWTAPRPG